MAQRREKRVQRSRRVYSALKMSRELIALWLTLRAAERVMRLRCAKATLARASWTPLRPGSDLMSSITAGRARETDRRDSDANESRWRQHDRRTKCALPLEWITQAFH